MYLQASDPRLKARVLKYLRCEDLTPRDRQDLGGIVPRTYASASQWMIQRLGELIWAVEKVPLVVCVDQLEDMFDQAEAPARFRRVLATLCDLTSRLPSAIVVISCLENFYDEVKRHLTQPISRRVTAAPGPVELPAACDREQVVALIALRLESLYRSAGVGYVASEPTYPLPDALVRRLVGLGARDVIEEVGRYRERCIVKGKMVAYPFDEGDGESVAGAAARELDRKIVAVEQAWNEARSAPIVVPSDESELAAILAEAIASCTGELEAGTGEHFEAEADGRFVQVERHGANDAVERILVGICNKAAQGGGLGKQIDEVIRRASGIAPAIVRSTAFPASAKSAVSAATPEARRRRRPPRGGRGLRVAHHDGPGPLPRGPRVRPGLRRLARADAAAHEPRGDAHDPGAGSSRNDAGRRRGLTRPADRLLAGDLDQVAAGVVEDGRRDRPHVRRLLGEPHPRRPEPFVLLAHVVHGERREGNPVLHQRPLERTGGGMAVRLEHQLGAVDILRRHDGQPPVLSHRDLDLLHEAEDLRVETQRLVLIVHQDAREIDPHRFGSSGPRIGHRSTMLFRGPVSM